MEAVCYAGGPAARGALYGDQQGFGGKLGMLKRSVQRGLQGIDNVYTQVANSLWEGKNSRTSARRLFGNVHRLGNSSR
jgi:hypothetical protein